MVDRWLINVWTLSWLSSNPNPARGCSIQDGARPMERWNGKPKCWTVFETDPKARGTLDVRAYGGNPVPYHPSVPARDQNRADLLA